MTKDSERELERWTTANERGYTVGKLQLPTLDVDDVAMRRCETSIRDRRTLLEKLSYARSVAEASGNTGAVEKLKRYRRHIDSLQMPSQTRCRLLELPAELREQIWTHTVTEWMAVPRHQRFDTQPWLPLLQKAAIRIDRLNRPWPPAITRVSTQMRSETLHLYYQHNIFECWRPLGDLDRWVSSTFIDWLTMLGPEKTMLLNNVVLMYKYAAELDYDVEGILASEEFMLKPGVVSSRRELTEYEACYEELGLPRKFGRRRSPWWAR